MLHPASYEVGGDPLTIRTLSGPVHGMLQGDVRRFLGVPYAAPPVGLLRFRSPQPVVSWTATLDATKPGNQCPQILPIVNLITGNEDCLFLNVFTPDPAPTRALPVMVWIHGGGFTVGSGMDDDPTTMVAKTGVIAVSINYRLGPLGFLALPQLAGLDPHHSTGDVGLEDQQAALKWVQANIARFGGDPNNVTIFGESAGGISVCAQFASPLSDGLFEKGITESGPCNLPAPSLAQAEAQGARYASALGCANSDQPLACLDTKPINQILTTMPPDPTFVFDRTVSWFPTADGVVLPANTVEAFDHGDFKHLPVIVGANQDEGRLFAFLAYTAQKRTLLPGQWADEVNTYFGPKVGPGVQENYPLSAYPNPVAAFGEALGDGFLACPAVESAAGAARYQPVYEYEFSVQDNPFVLATPGQLSGAFHSSELPYVFGGPVESSGPISFTPAQQRLSDAMMHAWARFAATGNPSGGGFTWPRLTRLGGSYVDFDIGGPFVATNMKGSVCPFWEHNGWSAADIGKYGSAVPNPFTSAPLP